MIHHAAALATEPLLVEFSTGKDSAVMLDLLMQHHTGPMTVVFLYFVDGLSIKERVLRHYEARYGIEIRREPCAENLELRTGKRWRPADVEAMLREKYNIGYIAQGVRKAESLSRRGMTAHLKQGVDERNLKFYPIAELKNKEVWAYVRLHKLPLPPEYNAGMLRDFWIPDPETMLWLKHTFPGDYRKIIAAFPRLEAMAKREEMYGR